MAERAVLGLAGILTPIVVVAILATDPFFRLWIGPAAAARCTRAGELLLAGTWINGLAVVPYSLLQARGRADLTAKFHLLELAPFVGLLWPGIYFGGVTGGAAVWCFRVAADAVLLFVATKMFHVTIVRLLPAMLLISFAVAASMVVGNHLLVRGILLVLLTPFSLFVAHATSPDVKQLALSYIREMRARDAIGGIGG